MNQFLTDLYTTLTQFNLASALFRILLAVFIGGCIGSERGRHGRAAGLRTHILVCLGAAMTVLVGLYSTQILHLDGDPMRISAQVITGVGFLGAGTIITRNHTRVTGLTTAAGLWATACLGLAIGAGFYAGAIAAWLLMTVTITIFTKLEHGIKQMHSDTYYLELSHISHVNEFVNEISAQVSSIQVLPAKSGTPEHIGLEIVTPAAESSANLLSQMQAHEYVLMAVPVAQEY